jgi:putative ABC transport system permease protein
MLTHYLAVALRKGLRQPVATLAGLGTLALGLASFVAAYAVADFWDSADSRSTNANRTLVATAQFRPREGTFDSGVRPLTNPWLAQYLQADFPRIEAVARAALLADDSPVRADERTARMRVVGADAAFLDIFDLPFVAGDPRGALREPGSVVLTAAAAQLLYGTEAAVGRTVAVDNAVEGTVTGVLGEIPEPSHMGKSPGAPLAFDMLVSQDLLWRAGARRFGGDVLAGPENWTNDFVTTYILLPSDGSLTRASLRRQLPDFVSRHAPAAELAAFDLTLDVVPVSRLLSLAVSRTLFPRQTELSVSVIALLLGALVLAVACANFVNLAVARAATRAREVGVRKAIGATARQVAAQHLVEVALLAAVALAVALAVLCAIAPKLDAALGVQIRAVVVGPAPWLALLALLATVTVAAGAYPAFLLARSAPMAALRLGRSRGGSSRLGMWLVGAQFTVVAFLAIAVSVVYLQNRELAKTGLGLASDPLLIVENDASVTGVAQATLRDEIAKLPGVVSSTLMITPPWTDPNAVLPFATTRDAGAPLRSALVYVVGEDFFSTLGIPLLAGRDFDAQRAGDVAAYGRPPTDTQRVVASRALADELGLAGGPEALIGRSFYSPAGFAYEVVGVVENSVLSISAQAGPRPRIYLFNPVEMNYHVVRLARSDVAGAVAAIDALWRRVAPNVAIERRFADDYFDESYAAFARLDRAFTAFALVAAAIALTGLVAVTLSVTKRRGAEIGVRKVFGGSTKEMVLMLLAGFARPVIIGNLVAWPFAYAAAEAYLRVFLNPIELTAAPFVACLGATLAIAAFAIGRQTLSAASANPAAVLRQE